MTSNFNHKGLYCHVCDTYIPVFPELEEKDRQGLVKLIQSDKGLEAMRKLTDEHNYDGRAAKIWVQHAGQPSTYNPHPPCPYCTKPLRTPRARRCLHCSKVWTNGYHNSLDSVK